MLSFWRTYKSEIVCKGLKFENEEFGDSEIRKMVVFMTEIKEKKFSFGLSMIFTTVLNTPERVNAQLVNVELTSTLFLLTNSFNLHNRTYHENSFFYNQICTKRPPLKIRNALMARQ
jgi:hypothetical protein